MGEHDYEPYEDVTLADVNETLKRIEHYVSPGTEAVAELVLIRGRLENVEDLLANIDKRGRQASGVVAIIILLGLILWRVW